MKAFGFDAKYGEIDRKRREKIIIKGGPVKKRILNVDSELKAVVAILLFLVLLGSLVSAIL